MLTSVRHFIPCYACCALLLCGHGLLAQKASCAINTAERSPLELAYDKGDTKTFNRLIAIELAAKPVPPKDRWLDIDVLLDTDKIAEAASRTDAWIAETPADPYALLALAELRHAQGAWTESYAFTLRSAKLNPCFGPTYAQLADFEQDAAYRLTAAKHLAIAHQLDPNNERITFAWIGSLPAADRHAAYEAFLTSSRSLDEEHRRRLRRAIDRIDVVRANRCELTSVAGTGEIHIPMVLVEAGDDRRWGLEVRFNGKPRQLILDTGASGFSLTATGRSGLHLVPFAAVHVGGIGNDSTTPTDVTTAESVSIGGLGFSHCFVDAFSNYGAIGGTAAGYGLKLDTSDGLIGTDVFDRYLVTVDYTRHEIRLAPLPADPAAPVVAGDQDALGGNTSLDWLRVDRYIAPSMTGWNKIYRQGHFLVLPATLSAPAREPVPALFIADTGADINIIDSHAIARLTQVRSGIGYVSGLSGTAKLEEAGAFTVDFAGLRLPVKTMDALDLHDATGPIGLLGQPVLEQLVMHIDYRDNLALFEAPDGHKM